MEIKEKELIGLFFKEKYPDERYVMKNYYHIDDGFDEKGNKLYIIEFTDTKLTHPRKMEIQVKGNELLTFKKQIE